MFHKQNYAITPLFPKFNPGHVFMMAGQDFYFIIITRIVFLLGIPSHTVYTDIVARGRRHEKYAQNTDVILIFFFLEMMRNSIIPRIHVKCTSLISSVISGVSFSPNIYLYQIIYCIYYSFMYVVLQFCAYNIPW